MMFKIQFEADIAFFAQRCIRALGHVREARKGDAAPLGFR